MSPATCSNINHANISLSACSDWPSAGTDSEGHQALRKRRIAVAELFELRWAQGGVQQVRAPVEAPNMLWLIQRDFLEGKTVQQMVSEALSEVPNPTRSVDIAQVPRKAKRTSASCPVVLRKHLASRSSACSGAYVLDVCI